MSENLAIECESFTTSFFMGDDVIPCLSQRSVEKLRDEAVTSLAYCPLNKTSILTSSACCCSGVGEGDPLTQHLKGMTSDEGTRTDRQRGMWKGTEEEDVLEGMGEFEWNPDRAVCDTGREFISSKVKSPPVYASPLYPPGRLLHIKREASHRRCCGYWMSTDEWGSEWVDRNYSQRVKVNIPLMLTDHFPWHVAEALEWVISNRQGAGMA